MKNWRRQTRFVWNRLEGKLGCNHWCPLSQKNAYFLYPVGQFYDSLLVGTRRKDCRIGETIRGITRGHICRRSCRYCGPFFCRGCRGKSSVNWYLEAFYLFLHVSEVFLHQPFYGTFNLWFIRIVLQDLTAQISALQKQIDETETDLRDEKAAHDMSKEELETVKAQVGHFY